MTVDGYAWVAGAFGDPHEVLAYTPRTWDAPADGALLPTNAGSRLTGSKAS